MLCDLSEQSLLLESLMRSYGEYNNLDRGTLKTKKASQLN